MKAEIRLSSRGRITIPKTVRDALGWTAGTKVEWIVHPDGAIEARPAPVAESAA